METGRRSPVLLSVEGGIAEIRFNRPEVLNAIDIPTARAFHDAVEAAVDRLIATRSPFSVQGK